MRGQYAIFADADGASKFEDLGKLVRESQKIEDAQGRGVAVGSRAHLVGSDAVVKVCMSTCTCRDYLLIPFPAVLPPQSPNALLPSPPPRPHATCNSLHTGYAMRLQIVLTPFLALYNTIHAFRGLDL